jgi:hypothetical protein
MGQLTHDTFFDRLGLEGGMNVFIPAGRTQYYVQFRIRVPGTVKRRQVMLSCDTKVYQEAQTRAAEIFADQVSKNRVSKASDNLASKEVPPLSIPNGNAKAQTPLKEITTPFENDPTIDEVLELFTDWIESAIPGEKRPLPETAKNYGRRLIQLADMLKLKGTSTISELKAKMKGLTFQKLGTSEGNFIALLRGAAGPFWPKPMKHYENKGIKFDTPFPFLPNLAQGTRKGTVRSPLHRTDWYAC